MDEHNKTKSTSVSSLSSIDNNRSIPIASIKKNRKLTLGEIQEVHKCTLIDNKLAFIVTLRATNSVAKVFRNDINTNSLRHAVPFSSLCNKHGCKNVNELEEKLINDNKNNGKGSNSDDITNRVTIEISCDSATSLKQLASIASVVSHNNNNNKNNKNESMDTIQEENMTDNEDDDMTEESEEEQSTITYNLRSNNRHKKRKFGELNDDDNKSVSTSGNEVENTNTNMKQNRKMKYKRPQFLRPIPNTVSVGPSISPTKLLNDLDINSIRKTLSAPNTPILNGNINNREIINLINSPSTKTLQFPQINLNQMNQQQNYQLFPTLNGLNGLNNGMNNINMKGLNNLNVNNLQQLAQVMLLQKRLGQIPINYNNNNNNNNGIITQITHLNPINMLPRLESEKETQRETNLNVICSSNQPPSKKLKLLNGNSMNINSNNNNNNINNKEEQFWSERLRLDGILNTHKVCEKQMIDLDSMRNWTHIIRTLQGQRLELLKVRQSIQIQYQTYLIEANRYHLQLQQLSKHNKPKNNQHKQLKLKIDEYKKQITEIYEKISKLSVKRKVLEKQLQTANQQMNKCQINIQQINNTSKQFNTIINDRKQKAIKLVEFMKTIDVISKQYCKSVENMQKKVIQFEPNYKTWNSGEVVTWFENINKGLLNKSESFLQFKKQLITNNVSGKDLVNLNHFSLKMMGLKNDKERNVIIMHLNKLLIHSNEAVEEPLDHETKNEDNDINDDRVNSSEKSSSEKSSSENEGDIDSGNENGELNNDNRMDEDSNENEVK